MMGVSRRKAEESTTRELAPGAQTGSSQSKVATPSKTRTTKEAFFLRAAGALFDLERDLLFLFVSFSDHQ